MASAAGSSSSRAAARSPSPPPRRSSRARVSRERYSPALPTPPAPRGRGGVRGRSRGRGRGRARSPVLSEEELATLSAGELIAYLCAHPGRGYEFARVAVALSEREAVAARDAVAAGETAAAEVEAAQIRSLAAAREAHLRDEIRDLQRRLAHAEGEARAVNEHLNRDMAARSSPYVHVSFMAGQEHDALPYPEPMDAGEDDEDEHDALPEEPIDAADDQDGGVMGATEGGIGLDLNQEPDEVDGGGSGQGALVADPDATPGPGEDTQPELDGSGQGALGADPDVAPGPGDAQPELDHGGAMVVAPADANRQEQEADDGGRQLVPVAPAEVMSGSKKGKFYVTILRTLKEKERELTRSASSSNGAAASRQHRTCWLHKPVPSAAPGSGHPAPEN